MSRIGKQPVAIPAGVKVRLADGKLFVEAQGRNVIHLEIGEPDWGGGTASPLAVSILQLEQLAMVLHGGLLS